MGLSQFDVCPSHTPEPGSRLLCGLEAWHPQTRPRGSPTSLLPAVQQGGGIGAVLEEPAATVRQVQATVCLSLSSLCPGGDAVLLSSGECHRLVPSCASYWRAEAASAAEDD